MLRAAARLFSAMGFQSASLDDIAASWKVTKPTLQHIDGKGQSLLECVPRGLAALFDGIRAATERGLQRRKSLRIAMEKYTELVTSDFDKCVNRVGEDPLSDDNRPELRVEARDR